MSFSLRLSAFYRANISSINDDSQSGTFSSISIHILWPRPFGEEKEKNYIGTPEWSPPNADRSMSLDRDSFSCINTLFVSIGTLISSIQKVHELVYRWQACGAWLEGPSDALNPNILTLSLNRISCIKSVFTFRKWTWLTKPSVLFDQRCPIPTVESKYSACKI